MEGHPGEVGQEEAGARNRNRASPAEQVPKGGDSPDHRAPHLVSATPAAHLARPGAGPSPTGPAQRQSAQRGVPRVGGTTVGGSSSRREGAEGHWPCVTSSPAASPHIYPHAPGETGNRRSELENTARVPKRPTCSPRPDPGAGTGLSAASALGVSVCRCPCPSESPAQPFVDTRSRAGGSEPLPHPYDLPLGTKRPWRPRETRPEVGARRWLYQSVYFCLQAS